MTVDARSQHQIYANIEARRIKPREGEPLHDITELKGLGKELWEQIDVDAYIEEERNSWDD